MQEEDTIFLTRNGFFKGCLILSEVRLDVADAKYVRADKVEAIIGSLLSRVNAVTAFHRHHSPVPKKKLDNLCARQIETENTLIDLGLEI